MFIYGLRISAKGTVYLTLVFGACEMMTSRVYQPSFCSVSCTTGFNQTPVSNASVISAC